MIRPRPVHLVKNFFDVPERRRSTILLGSEKIDGVFMFARKGIGYSRTGEKYLSLLKAAQLMNSILPDHVVIAEWCTYDELGDRHPVNIISGNMRRNAEFTGSWTCTIHDVIPINDFDDGMCLTPFVDRIVLAQPLYIDRHIKKNPQVILNGEDEQIAFANGIISRGGEGAVFKEAGGIWVAGKKNHLQMKIKATCSYDLECIGIELGREGTKYEGKFGKLIYRWTDGRTVSARGRISEVQGALYLAEPTTCIGKIYQVDGMCLTPDGMIREPVTIMERVDKEVADV
jgi:hypothetical protein